MSIPVYILTGYLGAGKTTALNAMLNWPYLAQKKLAVIVNEFANIGIDGQLLRAGNYAKYEINKGSIFCICTKTEFVKHMSQIADQVRPEALLIEATGIAETRDIENFTRQPNLRGKFHVKANICVVDAANFIKVAPFFKPATSQLHWADCVIINKIDLVSTAELDVLKKVIGQHNPDVPIFSTSNATIDFGFLNSIKHRHLPGGRTDKMAQPICSVSIRTDKTLDKQKFFSIIDNLSTNLLRLKGNIQFDSGHEFVELAGTEITCKPRCNELTSTAFVSIAWQIQKEELANKFNSTILPR